MRYAIVVNPKAGTLSLEEKMRRVKVAKNILGDCHVVGEDTNSSEEFCGVIREYVGKVEVIAPFGGDGTVFDLINSINEDQRVGFFINGSGNALRYHFNLGKCVEEQAIRIRDGENKSIDLIDFNGKKALFASIGLDGLVLKKRDEYLEEGKKGFSAYALSTIHGLFNLEPFNLEARIDGESYSYRGIKDFIVTKTPFYGYGLNVVPRALDSDSNLHYLAINQSYLEIANGLFNGFFGQGNHVGDYGVAKKIELVSDRDVGLQLNGDIQTFGREFSFGILPGKLKIKC